MIKALCRSDKGNMQSLQIPSKFEHDGPWTDKVCMQAVTKKSVDQMKEMQAEKTRMLASCKEIDDSIEQQKEMVKQLQMQKDKVRALFCCVSNAGLGLCCVCACGQKAPNAEGQCLSLFFFVCVLVYVYVHVVKKLHCTGKRSVICCRFCVCFVYVHVA